VSNGFAVSRLDQVTAGPGVEGSSWLQIRRQFDIRAFGVNAFRAAAGKRVIEAHDELGGNAGRHDELYIVVQGRARFEIDGDEIDAPVGTMLYVQPESRRGALAVEDDTTVVVVGGRPGEPFRVSPWEAAADAWPAYQAKDYEQAVDVYERALQEYPNAAGLVYNLACCEALLGRPEPAVEHLRRSIELEERFREFARDDEDFVSIRDRADVKKLLE